MIQLEKKPANYLSTAYNQMLQDMREALEHAEPCDMSLQKSLKLATQRAVYNSKITPEEAHEISEFIKRDINDAAEYMMENTDEFCDWVMLDIEIIERKVTDLYLSAAYQTCVELEQFKRR